MARYTPGNNPPLTHWKNLPIYLTTILAALFVVGMIFCAVTDAMRSAIGAWLVFEMPLAPAWSVWRLVSYVFLDRVNFFTPFSILFFYWMGVGIETHLGRSVFSRLLLLLMLTVPAIDAIGWWLFRMPSLAFSNQMLLAGLLVAFATLYPQTEAWGWIPFKWVAFACIFCGSLMILATRDWLRLAELWASCAVAFAFIRHAVEKEYDDYESPLTRVRQWFRRKPKLRVLPSPPPLPRRRMVESDATSEMDALLDKIAKSGMSSLTPRERARLEQAREALLKKDRR